jgi:pyruvate/2-oxoglutarate dehydrogenase complex dihydrolipoamide acyltransferase (E2) component
VETAKTTQEVEALVSGTLTAILVHQGETVAVHTAIALIEEDRTEVP